MKLIKFNLAQDRITLVDSSSENPNYPTSNVKHEFRAKEWRSNGYFLIDSSNKAIVLNEGSSDIEFDLLEEEYTPEQLASQFQNQLNSEGNNTYEVSFSRLTGQWTVSADDSFSLDGNFIEVIGFSEAVTGEDSYTSPRIALHTEEHLVFDMKTTEPIDTCVFLWEKDNYRLTSNAQLFIQANATNVWDSPAFQEELAFDNKNQIAQKFFNTQNYRYWRVVVKDPENVYGYVSLGTVILGKSDEVLTRTSNGFEFGLIDNSRVSATDFGQRYTDLYPKLKRFTLNFETMELEEVQAMIELFDRVGISQPLFISLDPMEAVFTNSEFWIYGKIDSSLGLGHQVRDIFNSSLEITEIN